MSMSRSASNQVDYAGWVYKEGSFMKSWKKRFMVLNGRQLTYYDTDRLAERTKEKGSFQVITVELSSEIQNGLLIHGRNGRVLKLYTDSAESTNHLYNAVMAATMPGGVDRASMVSDRYSLLSTGSQSQTVDVDALLDRLDSLPIEEPPVQYSGWLAKEGKRVKSWKRRFFSLQGNTLSYFDSSDTGRAAKGFGNVTAVMVNGSGRANSLDITFDTGRVLLVTADSAEDMQEWLCKLSDGIEANNANYTVRETFKAVNSTPPNNNFRASVSYSQSLPPRVAPTHQRHSLHGPSTSFVPAALDRNRSSSSCISAYSSRSDTLPEGVAENNQPLEESDSDSEGDWI